MEIFKIFYRTFLTFFLGLILLINLTMFVTYVTGNNPLGLPNYNTWDFTHYYFGFASITRALKDLGTFVNVTGLFNEMANFFDVVTLQNNVIGDAPQFDNALTYVFVALNYIINLVTFPVRFLAASITLMLRALAFLVSFIFWLYRLLGGYYNIPIPDTNNVTHIFGVLRYVVRC